VRDKTYHRCRHMFQLLEQPWGQGTDPAAAGQIDRFLQKPGGARKRASSSSLQLRVLRCALETRRLQPQLYETFLTPAAVAWAESHSHIRIH
jgi:hypothetical protein